jgi:hypothetical protein
VRRRGAPCDMRRGLGGTRTVEAARRRALAVLARIEEGRDLTQKELSYRHAFKMLCEAEG